MSVYGYLSCHDCRQKLWLGKAISGVRRPSWFHIGGEEELPHWKRERLNQVLWKFLADHCGHRIDVRLEDQMSDEMFGYQEIGGDSGDKDTSIDDYLAGWLGL